MNIKLLWLLASGKLGYLRQGWIRTQGVDPLKDYLWYRVRVYAFWVFAFIASLCAAGGWLAGTGYTIVRNLPHPPSPVTVLVVLVMVVFGTIAMYSACMLFASSYLRKSKGDWYRSKHFVVDVSTLLDEITEQPGKHVMEIDPHLMGIDRGSLDRLVPETVRKATYWRIWHLAQEAICVQRDKPLGWEHQSDRLKAAANAIHATGQRLELLPKHRTLQSFYADAKERLGTRLGTEKKTTTT